MLTYLTAIFGEVDFTTVSCASLACLYAFALVLECIASLMQGILKVGGVRG